MFKFSISLLLRRAVAPVVRFFYRFLMPIKRSLWSVVSVANLSVTDTLKITVEPFDALNTEVIFALTKNAHISFANTSNCMG